MTTIIEQIKQVPPHEAMEVAKAAAQQLADNDFERFRAWNYAEETERRADEKSKAEGRAGLLIEQREAGEIEAPIAEAETPEGYSVWAAPGDSPSAVYLVGDRVFHDGDVWQSLVNFNSWEPTDDAHTVWEKITMLLFPPAEGEALAYTDGQHIE